MMLGALVVLTASDRGSAGGPVPDRIGAPTIRDVMVAGLDVDLVWTWSDPRPWDNVVFRITASAWDRDAGQFVRETLVREEGLANATSYDANGLVQGTLSYPASAAGLHAFRVEVRAWNRPVPGPDQDSGHDTTFRAWSRRKVMIGHDGWSVVPLPGIGGDLLHHARDPEFRFFYELYRGPHLSRDCELDYRIGWPAAVHSHDCDWETGERALVLANPQPGATAAWRLTFAWSDGGGRFGDVRVEAVDRRSAEEVVERGDR